MNKEHTDIKIEIMVKVDIKHPLYIIIHSSENIVPIICFM